MFRAAPQFTDGGGRLLSFGRLIGSGGEGKVYEVMGDATVFAKVYHADMRLQRAPKIAAMIPLVTPQISAFCAWPQAMVFENRKPCGFLMPAIPGRKEIHVLHGVKSRKAAFPQANFKFLVRVALNVSRAVAALHDAGIIVGDFNDRGFLVGQDATVRLIDCDSFQVIDGKSSYLCEVGMANFTPPELQGISLRDQKRTQNHDAFSLATLIFLLLFMGRHPFAGRGAEELDQAIKEFRYAYSSDVHRTRNTPPPLWDDVVQSAGSGIASYFERAYHPNSVSAQNRPTANEWIKVLEQFEMSLSGCSNSKLHFYSNAQPQCPWCVVEARTGAELFEFVSGPDTDLSTVDVEAIWQALGTLSVPPVPSPRATPRSSDVTPSVLLPAISKAVDGYKTLKFEAERARSVALGVDRYISLEADRFVAIEAQLSKLDKPFGRLVARRRSYEEPWRLQSAGDCFVVSVGLAVAMALATYIISAVFKPAAAYIFSISMGCLTAFFSLGGLLGWRSIRPRLASKSAVQLALRRSVALARFPDLEAEWAHSTSKETALRREQQNAYGLANRMEEQAKNVRFSILQDCSPLVSDAEKALTRAQNTQIATANTLQGLSAAASQAQIRLEHARSAGLAHYQNWKTADRQRASELKRLNENNRADQLDRFLDTHFISTAKIDGISPTLKTTLRSRGIETAKDVIEKDISAASGFGPVRTKKMLDWRNGIAKRFTYDPTQGVDPAKIKVVERKFNECSRRCQRDIRMLHDDLNRRLSKLALAIPSAKRNADAAVDALAQAKANRAALEADNIFR